MRTRSGQKMDDIGDVVEDRQRRARDGPPGGEPGPHRGARGLAGRLVREHDEIGALQERERFFVLQELVDHEHLIPKPEGIDQTVTRLLQDLRLRHRIQGIHEQQHRVRMGRQDGRKCLDELLDPLVRQQKSVCRDDSRTGGQTDPIPSLPRCTRRSAAHAVGQQGHVAREPEVLERVQVGDAVHQKTVRAGESRTDLSKRVAVDVPRGVEQDQYLHAGLSKPLDERAESRQVVHGEVELEDHDVDRPPDQRTLELG